MVGFWEKEFDVLVCTTIVESGIDIPNANTLIVERADLLGLSQLHQIRGRVGRGRERAYAYFLYPREKPLTEHGARAAGHHRPAHRARRRHVRGDEGPGDPRRRQPARRRAVRPHRGRRLRPVRADGRRGGGASSRASGPRRSPRSRSTCRSTRTCRSSTSRWSGCAWRCTASSPRPATTARLDEVVAEMTDRYGEPPEPVANLIAVARFRLAGPRVRADRRLGAGQAPAVLAAAAARLQADAAQALPPGLGLQDGERPGQRARARRPAGSAASRCATRPCWSGAPSCSRTCSARCRSRCRHDPAFRGWAAQAGRGVRESCPCSVPADSHPSPSSPPWPSPACPPAARRRTWRRISARPPRSPMAEVAGASSTTPGASSTAAQGSAAAQAGASAPAKAAERADHRTGRGERHGQPGRRGAGRPAAQRLAAGRPAAGRGGAEPGPAGRRRVRADLRRGPAAVQPAAAGREAGPGRRRRPARGLRASSRPPAPCSPA